MLLTPGYHYQVLTNDDIYLKREEMPLKFKRVRKLAEDYKIINTPIYLDYLVGDRDLLCSPWTTVTRNPQGWKGPCYLITNGHYKTFGQMHEATDWEYYRTKQDIRCRDCKLHSGFEGTVGAAIRRESEGLVADGAALHVLTMDAAPRPGRRRAHGQYEDDLAIRTE